MSNGSETTGRSASDWLKWLVVLAALGGGVYGNWYYEDQSLLIRVGGLIALAAVALFVTVQTDKGHAAWVLIKEARSEIRRVVWPNWDEVFQTTMIVLVLVLVFAFVLWVLDSGLSWLVSSVIG